MRRMRKSLLRAALVIASCAIAPQQAVAAGPKKVESGKTQIVAKLDGREITVSELRTEMARLGLSPNQPGAERIALENVINRALLATAARHANMHKKPEGLRRMRAAQEQALADLYLSTASQPPEPTMTEIEDFILDNPTFFSKRRVYTFNVLSLPTAAFVGEDLTPLFDDTPDFADLKSHLDRSRASYAQSSVMQPSNAFPEAIRLQLSEYGVNDNIVIKSEDETQIMKIVALKKAPLPADAAPAFARRALLENGANERANRLVEGLKAKAKISYFRKAAAPLAAAGVSPADGK